ncbi:MAG TPA: VWA domain-containing protein [Gaiellaceae bacterium]|nr:VWA domain-containing protein [Gaiellaceae bacterium]
MRLLARIAIASAALAALVAPASASAQAEGTVRLQPARGWTFPDRGYVLQLPERRALNEAVVTVTENGREVLSLAVTPPDVSGKDFATVLLVDASDSMKGKPLADAMEGAREFAARNPDQQLAVIAFNDRVQLLLPFTTDEGEIENALATAPANRYGTHVYDALLEATKQLTELGAASGRIVMLSDGQELGSTVSRTESLAAAKAASARIYTIGLQSFAFDAGYLQSLSAETGGAYAEATSSEDLEAIYGALGTQLANEYLLSYRSLLPPRVEATLAVDVPGYEPAVTRYTTPALDFTPRGTFEREWVDDVIVSPWLLVFVLVVVFVLVAFAILTAIDVRRRSIRRRMAQYVTVPSEEESRARRAEVAAMLAERAHKRVGGQRWWQRFETDVELGGFKVSALALAAWTIVGGIAASIVVAVLLQSLAGLLVGFAAPFVTRFFVSFRVTKMRAAFAEQLPDNLDVLAGALRTGHALMGALAVMVDSADAPSNTEFRRVLQDEQLGVPLDDALRVMARRMESTDAEQVAMVMQLQREAGGNTAEVLDRVAETVRGRMELRRLVNVLTAQARISRWILTGLPIFLMVMLLFSGGDYLDPLLETTVGLVFLVIGAVMIGIGSFWIKRIAKMDV